MRSQLHRSHVIEGGVLALAISDGIHKPILELVNCTTEIWLHEADHCVV